jgi:hypothetical protein
MLDAFIIEEIKRREESRKDRDRPQPQVPSPGGEEDERPGRRSETEDEGPSRSVIVIDLAVAEPGAL